MDEDEVIPTKKNPYIVQDSHGDLWGPYASQAECDLEAWNLAAQDVLNQLSNEPGHKLTPEQACDEFGPNYYFHVMHECIGDLDMGQDAGTRFIVAAEMLRGEHTKAFDTLKALVEHGFEVGEATLIYGDAGNVPPYIRASRELGPQTELVVYAGTADPEHFNEQRGGLYTGAKIEVGGETFMMPAGENKLLMAGTFGDFVDSPTTDILAGVQQALDAAERLMREKDLVQAALLSGAARARSELVDEKLVKPFIDYNEANSRDEAHAVPSPVAFKSAGLSKDGAHLYVVPETAPADKALMAAMAELANSRAAQGQSSSAVTVKGRPMIRIPMALAKLEPECKAAPAHAAVRVFAHEMSLQLPQACGHLGCAASLDGATHRQAEASLAKAKATSKDPATAER